MNIYVCIKYESNTLMFSYQMETIFQPWKRDLTPKTIDAFYPKSNLTYIL